MLIKANCFYSGTLLFLLMGLGGIQAAAVSTEAAQAESATRSTNQVASVEQLLYISTSMGLALLAAAWTFFRVSGSVFNPNVAIALVLTGALSPMRFVLYVIAEISGAIAASAILKGVLPGKFSVSNSLGAGTKPWQGVLIEAFLTCALTLTVLLVAVEKHRATPFAPVAIGMVLFAAHLLGVVFTGAAMNSARAFGPAVVDGFVEEHWVYWVGPSFGALMATAVYIFLKGVDYYALTPKQDSDQVEDSPDLKGIEVRMRRRHQNFNSLQHSDRLAQTGVNVHAGNHDGPQMGQRQAASGYPAYSAYGAPTVVTGYNHSRPASPVSPNMAAGLAMAGGMGLALGGSSTNKALPEETEQQQLGSPRTSRYI
ncbi:aquaporin-like protein [Phakopsora pachyrhizi]|uniref:Aquaporin-like protein n=1 Tax=Phakopsora pachyrhizi TaxID=170000 RepID=A0AAV0AN36_PHAPC|nr:aquaporin-like protein [Phakopsora pachyrhizi]CAH7669702.1 aquaporin-like protein [Phakopsora pachyrhizi]